MGKNIYQESKNQSNGEDDKNGVPLSNEDGKENYGVTNTKKEENNVTIQRKIKIFGVEIETIFFFLIN